MEPGMHLTAHLDIDLLALSAEEEVTCLVELTAPTPPEAATRPGQAVVVVLDRSGSMGGEPIHAARTAIADLVRRLSPQDVFGLVTFDSVVDVVVPVGRIADRPVSTLLDAIASVEPRGSTDLSGGYVMGLREAARALAGAGAAPLSGATVLLLSDGQANAGIVDPEQLASLAAQAQRGATPTTTSTLGLGQHYDEVILAALARGGSGEHRYAPDTDAASAEFAGLVDDLLGKSVTGALLRVLPRPAVLGAAGADGRAAGAVDRIVVHGSLPSWVDGQAVVVNLGDLYGGEERQVLVTLGVPALASVGTATVAELELAYTSLPDLELHTVTLPVSVNVVPGDEARGRVPDARVAVARLLLDADEVKRAAAEWLRHGEVVEARTTLHAGIGKVRGSRDLAGDDAALAARIDAAVADLEEVERSTRERSAQYASKLAMESWNQTSRGKQRRRSRFVDEGFSGPVGGFGGPGGGLGRSVAGGRGVLLAKGDIVAVARGAGCDAIVNAANPGLIGDAGVAGAIFAAGGAALVQACAQHVAAHGRVAVGDAVATPGFGAGVPWVVHAVGPRYGIDLPSDELLAAAHRRAVEEADALGCTSIAIPAISTGVFGYPVDEAAPVALRAVEEALARCVVLTEVTFVLWDDATLAAYRAAAAGV
jgi:Ca-activated chloride channel homolog